MTKFGFLQLSTYWISFPACLFNEYFDRLRNEKYDTIMKLKSEISPNYDICSVGNFEMFSRENLGLPKPIQVGQNMYKQPNLFCKQVS